jgi:dTDP-4-amino-4,6-dideoxygalactose transaminase
MNIPLVDLNAQYESIKSEIDKAIFDVIHKSAYIKGEYVQRFEVEFANKYGVKHCISCANGTDALFIGLKMLGIGPGDEVITTALSWISTSESISLTGAKPVFVDIEEDYFTIDPQKIEAKITSKTKAVIPVHLYGQCANMDRIMHIARKYNLSVIEDSAQAHFAKYNGRLAGTIGDIGTFSFFPGKNLGAYGDAGAIITDNDELAIKMRMFANHGALKRHHHKIEGINSRLDGIQAAILSAKLPYIMDWTNNRTIAATNYDRLLASIPSVKTPLVRKDCDHVYHIYCIRVNRRDELKDYLESKEIEASIHYPTALPFLEAYKRLKHISDDFPVAYKYQSEILSIPIFPELSIAQQEYVANEMHNFVKLNAS